MDGPAGGGVRKAPTMCNKNDKCKNPGCTYFHFSPAANFTLHAEGDLINKPCRNGGNCYKASCAYNHPSPCLWGQGGGDAPSRTNSADSMLDNRRPVRPQRVQGQTMDMGDAENESFRSPGVHVAVLSQQTAHELLQTRQRAEALEEQNRQLLLQQQQQQQQQYQLQIQLQQQQQQIQLQQHQQQQMQLQSSFPQPYADDMEDDDMGTLSGAATTPYVRDDAASRTDSRVRNSAIDLSGNIDKESDDNVRSRAKPKRGDVRDLRSSIGGDLRNDISSPHHRVGTDMRNDLRSGIGGDVREVMSNPRNRTGMDYDEIDVPVATPSGKLQGLTRKPSEINEGLLSKGASAKPIFPKPSPKALVGTGVSPSVGADSQTMPPPRPKIFAPPNKHIETRPSDINEAGHMPPPSTLRSKIFNPSPVFKPKTPPASTPDSVSQHGGSVTPICPSSPIVSAHTARTHTNVIPSTVPGFKFGEEYLKQCAQIVDSSDFNERFRKEQDGFLVAEMHDDMCHPKEWEERERTSVHNPLQPTYDTAYSDSELRRETNLTTLYRSIKGIKKTMDHIQQSFKGDTKDGCAQFSISIYPTLRAAENDLKNVGNKVYSIEWIVTVERMIKFCMHMYFLTTKVGDHGDGAQVVDMHSKSLEYAKNFMEQLMDAYQEMWAHHVMPPNCEEFCSLSLATSALARTATSNNKGGGLAGLCRDFFKLPLHIRQKPQVKRTLDVLLCYFGDNITKFFELLNNGCPYLVVLMCSSEFYQIRCRFLKNFFATKTENIPFETIARHLFHGFSDSKASLQLVQLLSSLRCTQATENGDIEDMGSIFEIETSSKPPLTMSFKSLAPEAVEITTKKKASKGHTTKDFVHTFHRAMGLEFEKIERLPVRPQVDNHPGKFGSFRVALQESKKSDFRSFSVQPQQFVFSNWPKLDGTDKSTVTFSSQIVTPRLPALVQKVPGGVFSPLQSKPSESVETSGTHNKEGSPRVNGSITSVSPTASNSVNATKPKPKIFPVAVFPVAGARATEFPAHTVLISPSPGPDTPPGTQQHVFPPTPSPFQLDRPRPTAISLLPVTTASQTSLPLPVHTPAVEGASEMEDRTQPSPARPFFNSQTCQKPFLLPTNTPTNVSGGLVTPVHNVQTFDLNAVKFSFESKTTAPVVIASTSTLKIDLNEIMAQVEQDHDYHDTLKLTRNESSWELTVTLNVRQQHGDWMSPDAAIQLWFLDMQRAKLAFTRPSEYGSVLLSMFGLGSGRRSVHFDWVGTTLAVVGSNLPDESPGPVLPERNALSANFVAVVYSWIVQDPYDVFQDSFQPDALTPHDEMAGPPRGGSGRSSGLFLAGASGNPSPLSLNQKFEKNDVFKALQGWAANKFAAAASRFDVGSSGTKTLVSCFHASSPADPATIAVTLISPHKKWPFEANDNDIAEWNAKTCNRIKSVVAKNITARTKGSIIMYFPFLVFDHSYRKKIWKPSAQEMKEKFEASIGGPSDVSFVCLSPWEVLEVSEYLHSNVPYTRMTRETLTDIWVHCLPSLNPIRGVQESIYDCQRDNTKFQSYGWPDITRSYVPRVQTITRCASAAVRSVLTGCYYLIDQQEPACDQETSLSGCLFDTVGFCLFDTVTVFCQKLYECLVSSRAASVKEVLLLTLEACQDLFEEILNSLVEDPVLQTERTRKLLRDANVSDSDISAIVSSSDDRFYVTNALNLLNQAFVEGLRQLSSARKIETLDQCEAVAKCTISIVNNLLKDPAPLSPNRRWRDDELWKKTQAQLQALSNRIPWKSHCQEISAFLTTASFCGTEKNAEFPNGRRLDVSYHRIIAFRCLETLFFFVSATVLHGGPAGELEIPSHRNLNWLRRSKSGTKDIQQVAADALQKFQTEVKKLKEIKPHVSPPPPIQMKPPVVGQMKSSSLTPRRRRSANTSGDGQLLVSDTTIVAENRNIAPGLRVLHDVQISEHDLHDVSSILNEDCRINQEFEQQMESFISGTLAFLENSGSKRVRDDIEDRIATIEKDRRINREFEEELKRALQSLE